VTGKLTSSAAYDAAMRKLDPERIYLARRAAILSRLTDSGEEEERAETPAPAGRQRRPPEDSLGTQRDSGMEPSTGSRSGATVAHRVVDGA
jgi:hypothetical protein